MMLRPRARRRVSGATFPSPLTQTSHTVLSLSASLRSGTVPSYALPTPCPVLRWRLSVWRYAPDTRCPGLTSEQRASSRAAHVTLCRVARARISSDLFFVRRVSVTEQLYVLRRSNSTSQPELLRALYQRHGPMALRATADLERYCRAMLLRRKWVAQAQSGQQEHSTALGNVRDSTVLFAEWLLPARYGTCGTDLRVRYYQLARLVRGSLTRATYLVPAPPYPVRCSAVLTLYWYCIRATRCA
eukprot:1750883-Rhodomonas_salina.1